MTTMTFEKVLRYLEANPLQSLSREEVRVAGCDDPLDLFTAFGRRRVPGLTVDDDNRHVYRSLACWALGMPFSAADPAGGGCVEGSPLRGIYIAGPTGAGKTVAVRVLGDMCSALNVRVSVAGTDTALAWRDRRATDIAADFAVSGELTAYFRDPVLCIQDLGGEARETLFMGNRVEVMRQILETRGDNPARLTIITSNIPLEGAGEVYGARVASRLRSMCNYFVLGGRDRRAEP